MGRLITFEGIEGCGKTTQAALAGEYLQRLRIPFVLTEEPGGTPFGKRIREILLTKTLSEPAAKAELLLFAADRAQHVKEVIEPALEKGKAVLCDRFIDATVAYQGFGRGLDIGLIKTLNAFSTGSLRPDLTLLFDLPVETALMRVRARRSNKGLDAVDDRFEGEEAAFHRKVREGYLRAAAEEPHRFRIIDASREISQIQSEVEGHLAKLLAI
ncbi:MAG: dTMP kinase [Deltaproteobacteria bacterium]|nr:dTMP kinase [Deltaproteobacteria bacterium]